jgi:hypothetical protein
VKVWSTVTGDALPSVARITKVNTPEVVGVPVNPVEPNDIPAGSEPLCKEYEKGATPSRISNVSAAEELTTVH